MLATRYLERLRRTGDEEDLVLAGRAAQASLAVVPAEENTGGLAVRARVEHASHRFAAARDTATRLTRLVPDKPYPFQILGDALLELGDYDGAGASYARMRRIEGSTVETESRSARLALVHGDLDSARERFSAALALARESTPPQPETVAWCSVQIGQICFGAGDWEGAETYYLSALKTLPDGLSALEHLAELRAAQSRYDDAVELYRRVIARAPRPEFLQALGDVYSFEGLRAEAEPWHEQALAAYLASVERGLVHYYHHLAGFYSDSREDAAEALRWAREDLELRKSVFAYDAQAWALYRGGQFRAAAEAMEKALSMGTKDAHLFFHAGMIYSSAGDLTRGRASLRRAMEINPRYNAFHVHR